MANSKKLSEQIDYQNGSVVSKEIVNKATGTITLFAFDKGQGLSEHTAPYDAFVLILEGSAVVIVSGTENQLGLGESHVIPANHPHSLKANLPFKMVLTMIKA